VILFSLYFSFSIFGHLTLYSTNNKERVSLFNRNEKKKKFHTTRTIPNSNIKIVERDKIDIPNIPNT
jgi:restriction endonuclease S subunit